MTADWDRRKFMRRTALGCAGIGATTAVTVLCKDKGRNKAMARKTVRNVKDFSSPRSPDRNLMVVASGPPDTAVAKAIAALGGIDKFVKFGETVVIKPNVGWDRTPIQAGNTNPQVVGTVVKLCKDAGAKEVIVTDNTCNEPGRCFTRSGIWKAVEAAGGKVVLPAEHRFKEFDLGGKILDRMPVLTPAVEADRFINIPIAKHHGLSQFTGAMKNLYGVLGGRRNRLHQKIDDSIADLSDFIRPTLTIMDATRVLLRNGPQGGNIKDTKLLNKIVASVDQVAVDAYCCAFIGLTPADLPYLQKASERGLGEHDLKKMTIKEVS